MRNLVLTIAALALTGPAAASSIEVITGTEAVANSIVTRSCSDCPPLMQDRKPDYVVPSVPMGQQTAEIVDVDGKKKLKRVESWLGGSPVVVMSNAEGWATDGATIVAEAPRKDMGIDPNATTAAIEPIAPNGSAPATAGFELRLK